MDLRNLMRQQLYDTYHAQWVMNVLMAGLAVIFFLVPAGRFYFEIAGYAFSSGFNVYKMFPVLFLLWGVWRWRNPAIPLLESSITLPFAAFTAVCVLSSLTSIEPYQSLTETLELLIYLIFYLMLIDLPWNAFYLRWMGIGFVAGSWYLIYTSAAQLLAADDLFLNVKLNGPFDYPNAMGVFCILCAGILCWLTAQTKPKWMARTVSFTMVCVIACGMFTQSRAVFISMLAAFIVWMALGGNRMKVSAVISVVIICILGAVLMLPKFVGMESELQTQNEMSRLMIWTYLFENFLPGLPLFGYGLGPVIPDRMADWLSSTRYTPYLSKPWHPHNLYLYILFSAGIPGLLAFGWWMKESAQLFLSLAQKDRCILCASLTGFLVYQCFEVHLLLGNIPVALIALLAIGTKMPKFYFNGDDPLDE